MHAAMIPVVTAAEMRELDRATIEGLGLPGAVLMENAGRAVADEVSELARAGAEVAVLCGSGNNGGDGFVCARWLRERGVSATVYLASGRPRTGGDAALHLGVLERSGGTVVELDDAERLERHAAAVRHADVVVDALLGTGLKNEVKGHLAAVIAVMNESRGVRVAVDVPSGLDSDSGKALGAAVRADRTVTLAFPKVGVVGHPGFEVSGQVLVADIGIPRALTEEHGIKLALVERADVSARLPRRDPGGHKGTYGHVLVVAGSAGRTGAALLCARAALRAGAGLVTLAVPAAARAAVEGRVPEVMCAELDYEGSAQDALAALLELADGKRAIAIGPGMPTTAEAGVLLRAALTRLEVPLVLDADALNHLAVDRVSARGSRAPLVMTPHPAEAGRLLGIPTTEVQADRVGAARRLAAEIGAVVVLKGARTVTATSDGFAAINPTGNPGMGTGGTGDVLTGVIAALLGQGLDPYVAARVGAYVHGHAGDLAKQRFGEIGLMAGDLADTLPEAFRELAET
jgi:ADP-dependent NAD(P)H-hydrate dehydratase / NAD(P)H-hydrate epimerase